MGYELTGTVKVIQEPQTFSSGFTKRELVVTVAHDKYPQDINIEFVQDRVQLLDSLSVGQEVTITFDIRGREYNGRYYNNLQAWELTSVPIPEGESERSPVDPADDPPDEILF